MVRRVKKSQAQGLEPGIYGGIAARLVSCSPCKLDQARARCRRGQDALATAGETPALRSFFRNL